MSSVNDATINLIKSFEGNSLTVYEDTAGLGTCGYGHRTNLPLGATITQEDADSLFEQDLQVASDSVRNACGSAILTDNQFGALVSLTFNIGAGNFRNSTLLRNILAVNFDAVPAQFLRWSKSNGKQSAGLLRRRQAEAALWSREDSA